MTIIGNGNRYTEYIFPSEKDFEDDVVLNSNILFGNETIYINAKKKIEAKALGGSIPDGFFFDFADKTDPQFYIVEIEVTQHSFFSHVFPQITKFFAFYKNTKLRKELVDKLYAIVTRDDILKNKLREFLGKTEIYKFISDIIESSQNILLIADGEIPELPEIIDTYTDTWGKLVRFVEIKKYIYNSDVIYTIIPDFEIIQYIEHIDLIDKKSEDDVISEEDHLEKVNQIVRNIYSKIKQITLSIDETIVFNPQKYYISIKAPKNIAYMEFRIKKIRFVTMMPEDRIKGVINNYTIVPLSEGIQKFYNGPCAAVDIPDLYHEDELLGLIKPLISYHRDNEKQE
jgi:predicted transport protein